MSQPVEGRDTNLILTLIETIINETTLSVGHIMFGSVLHVHNAEIHLI